MVGFVVADTAGKRYLSRAIGPGLGEFGAAGVVPHPHLTLVGDYGSKLERNIGWEDGPSAFDLPAIARTVGAFPLRAGSRDAALVSELRAGTHTLNASASSGAPGVGLVELYELESGGRTTNLSARAMVTRGGGSLVAGFVVQGPAVQRVLIRAASPTLANLGLTHALVDPVLTVYAGPNAIASSDRRAATDDTEALRRAARMVGAFPLGAGSEDAALFLTLEPGAYTVELQGKGTGGGVGLLEIYDVP